MGPFSALTHTECQVCRAQNSQIVDSKTEDDEDADEQMTIGLDCCPHYVPYGSDCYECDEEEADMAMGLTPNTGYSANA